MNWLKKLFSIESQKKENLDKLHLESSIESVNEEIGPLISAKISHLSNHDPQFSKRVIAAQLNGDLEKQIKLIADDTKFLKKRDQFVKKFAELELINYLPTFVLSKKECNSLLKGEILKRIFFKGGEYTCFFIGVHCPPFSSREVKEVIKFGVQPTYFPITQEDINSLLAQKGQVLLIKSQKIEIAVITQDTRDLLRKERIG